MISNAGIQRAINRNVSCFCGTQALIEIAWKPRASALPSLWVYLLPSIMNVLTKHSLRSWSYGVLLGFSYTHYCVAQAGLKILQSSFPSSLDYRNEQQTQLINRFLNTSSLLLVLEEGSLFQQRHSQSTPENTHGANDANLCIFIINWFHVLVSYI